MAKVLELQPDENSLLLKAQWGLRPELLGTSVGPLEPDNPPAQALLSGKPTVAHIHTWELERVPAILREFNAATSVNIPLISRDGPYGVLELDYTVPHEPGALELSYLGGVATVIADSIERTRETQSLVSDRELKVVLLREQQHRIRNNFQTVLGLLQVNEQITQDTESKRRFSDVARRVFALVSLYDHLLGQADQDSEVLLSEYLSTLCGNFSAFYDLASLGIELELELDPSVSVEVDTCTGLGTVVNELLANAVEHAFGNGPGRLQVVLCKEGTNAFLIEIRDNGRGYGRASRDSIGLHTARRLIASIGGSLQMFSPAGHGTTWRISVTQRD